MKLLLPIAKKILIPPLTAFLLITAYKLYRGELIDLKAQLEALVFLSLAVLAVWAPLPLAQYFSGKFPKEWQSLMRLIFGVTFASVSFGFFIYIAIRFNLFV